MANIRPTAQTRPISTVTTAALVAVSLLLSSPVLAHEEFTEQDVTLSCPVANVAGTLVLPAKKPERPLACVVILGGTMSHTRDGVMVREGAPARDALKRLAHALAEGGYASLRFDKVGYGTSKPTSKWTGSYQDEATVAAAAIQFARDRKEFERIVAAGESAGAYLACLAAKEGVTADAYIFLGGHCGPGEAIYEYNFAPLVRYAQSSPEHKAWAEKNLRYELTLGKTYKAMFAAAARGEPKFEMVDGDFRQTVDLKRRREEIEMPPDEMFKHIQVPALAVAGDKDLNVPGDHAARIVSVMRSSGNHSTTCVLIPGVDHSFQEAAEDEDQRFRERYNFESFRRPYDPQIYREVLAWLDKTVPSLKQTQPTKPTTTIQLPKRAVEAPETDAKTENTPERLHLAPGVQIIENITDKTKTAGVETLEGRIGPLLLGGDSQAHFIDMPSGMYCEEHPHSTESIIFTVRGKWVLCSSGRRHVMKPGSLFHFAAGTPTGYEVPFAEDAYILIFKGSRTTEKEKDFIEYLKGMAQRLKQEQKAGIPYLLKDLPSDHPARRFAEEVNRGFLK